MKQMYSKIKKNIKELRKYYVDTKNNPDFRLKASKNKKYDKVLDDKIKELDDILNYLRDNS